MDKAKKNGEAGLEVKIDSLTKLVTTVVEENKQLRERLEIVEKRLAAVEKDLSKIKMRDIIKAFAESLVRTFAKFIPIASTSKKDVVEYWLISSRQDDFINKLIIQLETTDSAAHSKALTITDDVDKFVSAVKLCCFDVRKQFNSLTHNFYASKTPRRKDYPFDEAAKAAESLSPDMVESAVMITECLQSKKHGLAYL